MAPIPKRLRRVHAPGVEIRPTKKIAPGVYIGRAREYLCHLCGRPVEWADEECMKTWACVRCSIKHALGQPKYAQIDGITLITECEIVYHVRGTDIITVDRCNGGPKEILHLGG